MKVEARVYRGKSGTIRRLGTGAVEKKNGEDMTCS